MKKRPDWSWNVLFLYSFWLTLSECLALILFPVLDLWRFKMAFLSHLLFSFPSKGDRGLLVYASLALYLSLFPPFSTFLSRIVYGIFLFNGKRNALASSAGAGSGFLILGFPITISLCPSSISRRLSSLSPELANLPCLIFTKYFWPADYLDLPARCSPLILFPPL